MIIRVRISGAVGCAMGCVGSSHFELNSTSHHADHHAGHHVGHHADHHVGHTGYHWLGRVRVAGEGDERGEIVPMAKITATRQRSIPARLVISRG